ncbi:trypsin domain-containing protein [Ditylenchus destructor]|uniref:Trypsin domain-containing protein n=1 Tax=Ditylenchus destructor TaxID=166010 RepID=A0AAD4QRY4_9BILA|nr:trypsin domain-containing protein [Ditylenchus destructor]
MFIQLIIAKSLQLAKRLKFSNLIQPICLAGSFQENGTDERETAVIAGWGWYDDSAHVSTTLREGLEHFINIDVCKKSVPLVDEKLHICGDGTYQHTMQHDSGCPIFVKSPFSDRRGNPRWMEVGVNDFNSHPDVFTRVSTQCEFIKNATKGEVQCIPMKPLTTNLKK